MVRGVRDRAVRLRWWVRVASTLALAAPALALAQAPVNAAPAASPTAPPAAPTAPIVGAGAEARVDGSSASTRKPWIQRFRPVTRHRLEFGAFGGVFLPNKNHELYDVGKLSWASYARVAGSLGLRVAYLPIPWVGAEFEAAVMPVAIDASTAQGSPMSTDASAVGRANLYAIRGHAIAQLPLASVVPFVLVGGGGLGARSNFMGSDLDLAAHFGGGVKVFVHRWVGLRLDVRGTVTSRYGTTGSRIVHPEVLLGVVIPLGLQARDSDGDGSYDPDERRPPVDLCPEAAGSVHLRGCPDGDRDTVADPDDRCPDTAGLGERRGCPALRDSDRDTVYDPGQVDIPPPGPDKCPDLPGLPAYVGCPAPDSDGDGIADPDDRCVDRRESTNGFQDDDGCPDEVPIDVKEVIGALRSINFAFMSDTITDSSRPELDHTVEIMRKYPTIRVEVQGHTDDEGDRAVNLELSRRRAEAVRQYIITAGVDATRLRAVGYGGDKPVVDNKTEAGKARNRRIEIRLLDTDGKVLTVAP